MAVHFEYKGKHYEFADGTTPDVAKQKIQAFLGEQSTPVKSKGLLEETWNTVDSGVRDIADLVVTAPNLLFGGLARSAGQLTGSDTLTNLGESMFSNMEETQKVLHEGEQRPETLAGKVVTNAAPIVASIPLGGAGIGTALTAGFAKQGSGLVQQGVDASTARNVAALDTAGNAAGALVPGGRIVQALANPVVGTATDAVNQRVLQSKGYDEVAEQYDPLNLERRLTDAVVGAALPGVKPKKKVDVPINKAAERVLAEDAQAGKSQEIVNYQNLSDVPAYKRKAVKQAEELQQRVQEEERIRQEQNQKLETPLEFENVKEPFAFESKPVEGLQDSPYPHRDTLDYTHHRAETMSEGIDGIIFQRENPTPEDIDTAWNQRTQERDIEQQQAFDVAKRVNDIKQEPVNLEPEQGTKPVEKSGTSRKTVLDALRKKQGGAIHPEVFADVFKKFRKGTKNVFESFYRNIKEQYPQMTDDQIKRAWKYYQEEQDATMKANALGKIDKSLKESLSVYKDTDKGNALNTLKAAPDNDSSKLGFARNNLLSRGRLGVEKIKNEGIKAGVAYIVGLRDAGHIEANNTLHGDKGILRGFRKLETLFGPGKSWEVLRQRFEAQFNPEYKYNLDPEQMKLKEQLDKVFDDIHSQIEQVIGKPLHKIPNYFPSMFYGDFSTQIRDADGRLVAYVTETSAKAAKEAAAKVIEDLGIGFSASEPIYRHEMSSATFRNKSGLGQHFEAMLDLLASDDPTVQRAQEAVQREVAKRAFDTRNFKNRLQHKSGIVGAEGQKSWKSDRENYFAAKDVLENYVRGFHDFKANMETAKFLKELQDQAPDKKNNYNILQNYFDDIRGNGRSLSRIANELDTAMSNAFGVGVGSGLTKGGRWTANALTKLWLGFWNPVSMVQNTLQPLHTISKLVDMTAYGGSSDVISPVLIGYAKSLMDITNVSSNKLFKTDLSERAKYLKDFEVIKPGLIEARDRTKAGHFAEKGVVSGGLLASEALARTTTFNIFSTYLQKSGMSKAEAYEIAKNMTHDYMVNYEQYAKPGVFNNTGALGELAGRLQTYKANQFTQLANYIQTFRQMKDPKPAATALALSVAMAGASGMIGMDIAEGIYGLLVKAGWVEPTTRSPRQVALDLPSGLGAGIPTEASGKWLSGSLTSNLVGDMDWRSVAPIIMGAIDAASQIPTAGKWMGDAMMGTDTVPDSEKAQLMNKWMPAVARGKIEDKYLTDKNGIVHSMYTGESSYKKGPQDDNLLSKFTNVRSKERGETLTRKALLVKQEKNIKDKMDGKIKTLQKLFDEAVNRDQALDEKYVKKQIQDIIDLGGDPNYVLREIQSFIQKNSLGDWFDQQLMNGQINVSNIQRKMRANQEREAINN
jgi:hypothetical protein